MSHLPPQSAGTGPYRQPPTPQQPVPQGPSTPNPNQDKEHLNLLFIGHTVLAALMAGFLLLCCSWTLLGYASMGVSSAAMRDSVERMERMEAEQNARREQPKNWERKVIERERTRSHSETIKRIERRQSGMMAFSMIRSAIYAGVQIFFIANMAYGASLIRKRANHMHLFVSSIITCLVFPLGTLLGVFTIIVILRPTAKRLFSGPHFQGTI